MQIMQLAIIIMPLATMRNAEISINTPLLLASANTVIIMFDFEPFNSVITTHYFSVFFDLHSLQLKNSVFFHAATILDYNYFLCVCVSVRAHVCMQCSIGN